MVWLLQWDCRRFGSSLELKKKGGEDSFGGLDGSGAGWQERRFLLKKVFSLESAGGSFAQKLGVYSILFFLLLLFRCDFRDQR